MSNGLGCLCHGMGSSYVITGEMKQSERCEECNDEAISWDCHKISLKFLAMTIYHHSLSGLVMTYGERLMDKGYWDILRRMNLGKSLCSI